MAKNILVISVELRETRVALIEDGIIAELHIERKGNKSSTVGNVYLGKVTRVLPGLQAAFIDIGQERAAFLHVEDLIRPDDFETYLAGGRRHAAGASAATEDAVPDESEIEDEPLQPSDESVAALPDVPSELLLPDVASEATLPADDEEDEEDQDLPEELGAASLREDLHDTALPDPSEALIEASVGEAGDDAEFDANASDEDDADEDAEDASQEAPEDQDDTVDSDDADEDAIPRPDDSEAGVNGDESDEDEAGHGVAALGFDADDLPGFTMTDPGDPVPVPRAPGPRDVRDNGRRGRRRRGRGRGEPRPQDAARAPTAPAAADPRRTAPGKRGPNAPAEARPEGRRGKPNDRGPAANPNRGPGGNPRNGRRGSERDGGKVPARISKTTPIREVVREGQEIIVQVSKDPIGTKGARCSSHVSLPGRYVVYLPTVEHIGVSKRIGNEKERARLRETIEGMKPPSGGLIVRTVAEGLTKKQLKQDVGYLVRLWGEVAKKREGARAPNLLSSELDLVLKVARDLFTDEVEKIVIDDRTQYDRTVRFVEMFAPERVKDVEMYTENEPIFDAYGIEDEIARALSRKVPLPSGGYLIIDQAEALTAIDVNTGRFVGKGSKDMEETILKTNLEAVHEIAYQLRFRNIGGLIILDLIDMEKASNREKVRRTLEDLLQKDKAKTTLNRISDLGLIEMTRKRTRESLGRQLHEPCFYCDGTGQLQSKETIAFEILREIRRKYKDLPGYSVIVNAHPAVVDLLNGPEKSAVLEAESRYLRKINVVARKDYHMEQFDIVGR